MEAVFPSNRNVFLNEFSILASGNRHSVQLKQCSFIQSFVFCLWKPEDPIFEKITLFLLVETDFLASGNYSFSSNLRPSCHCQLYFSTQRKRIFKAFWLVETHFCLVETLFLSIFQSFLPVIVFFLSSKNVVLKRILHSGQWKLIFWIVDTILCQYLKYPFHWKQFFHLLEMSFKRILYYSQWQRIFFLVETIFFHSHFLETIITIRGRRKFLKNLVSVRRSRFL